MTKDILAVAGLALVCIGVGMIYIPAAVILTGVALVLVAHAMNADDEKNEADKK